MVRHKYTLAGLEPDNLLAFLALLGALRALDARKPEWSARAVWEGAPLRPVLELTAAPTHDEVSAIIAQAVGDFARYHEFGGYTDLKLPREECRALLTSAVDQGDRDRLALLAALMTDGAVNKDGIALAPPLSTMAGQGHQHFLNRLRDVPQGELPKELAKRKRRPDLTSPRYIAAALFHEWTRSDPTDAFRWDPQEDRRYALRAVDPSADAATTEHGANRLAAIALALLPAVPTGKSGPRAIGARGFLMNQRRQTHVTWPIWRVSASLETVVALLDDPALCSNTVSLEALRRRGVVTAYRAYRIPNGYFANFTRAVPVVEDATGGG